jgi:segregation and condensation protein B
MDNINIKIKLSSSIEAILFYTAEPMTFKKLSSLTKSSIGEIKEAAIELRTRLDESGSGVRLLIQEDEVVLGTAPEIGALIEQITKEEISKELSKASMETLAIICYKGPLTRSDIDYIRGVNSTFIIRNLLIRGIVEKLENPRDSRAMLYGPTFSALEYMGVTKIEDLPQYSEIKATLESFSNERILDEELVKPESKNGEIEPVVSGDAEGMAILCDTDGDGTMSEKECKDSNDYIIHSSEDTDDLESTEFEADLAEENIMAPSYIDDEIISHNEDDADLELNSKS